MLSNKEIKSFIPDGIKKKKPIGNLSRIIHNDTNYAITICLTPREAKTYRNQLNNSRNYDIKQCKDKKGRIYTEYTRTIKDEDGYKATIGILPTNFLNFTLGIKLTEATKDIITGHWDCQMPVGNKNCIKELNSVLKTFIREGLVPEIEILLSIILELDKEESKADTSR